MAKRHIIPLGKHKVSVQSQFAGLVIHGGQLDDGKYAVYHSPNGLHDHMVASYEEHKARVERHKRVLLLKQKMLDKGLL